MGEEFERLKNYDKNITIEENGKKYRYVKHIEYKDYKVKVIEREHWKIENRGFNEQKNHGYFIQHAFSRDYNAMKKHYLLAQIAHTIRQLMKNGIEKYKKYKKK